MTNTQNDIHRQWCEIIKEKAELKIRLDYLQYHCKHPNKRTEHCGDTGNWSKSDDSYWLEHECPDCGKYWTEDL